MINDLLDGGEHRVIDNHNTADLKHLVDVEEIDQCVVKGMPSINNGSLYLQSFCEELRQDDFRPSLVQLYHANIAGTLDVGQADTVVQGCLERVRDDVPTGNVVGFQGIAGVERRNAKGETDFDGASWLHRPESPVNQLAFLWVHFIDEGHLFGSIPHFPSLKDFLQNRIHSLLLSDTYSLPVSAISILAGSSWVPLGLHAGSDK